MRQLTARLLPALALLAAPARADVFDTVSDRQRAETVARLLEERFVATAHPDNVVIYVKKARVEPVTDWEGKPAFAVKMVRQALFKHSEPPVKGQRVVALTSGCGEVVSEGMEKESAYLNYLYVQKKDGAEFMPVAAYVKLPELPDYYANEAPLTLSSEGLKKLEACKKELDRKAESYPLAELTVFSGSQAVYTLERFEPETIDSGGLWEPSSFIVKPRNAKDDVVVDVQDQFSIFCTKGDAVIEKPGKIPPSSWRPLKRKGAEFSLDPSLAPTLPPAKVEKGCGVEVARSTFRVRVGDKVLKSFVVEPVGDD